MKVLSARIKWSLASGLDLFWTQQDTKSCALGMDFKDEASKGKTEKQTKPISRFGQAPIQFTALVLYKRKRSYNFTGYHQTKLTGFKTYPSLRLYL